MTTQNQTVPPEGRGIAASQGSGQDVLAPETRGLLQSRKLIELLKDAKLKTQAGVTTIAGLMAEEAGLIPPQEAPPPEAPQSQPPEQQGIASVLEQAQQAAPSVAQNMQQAQGGPPVGVPPEMAPPGMPPPEMAPPGMPPQGMPPPGMPPQGMAPQGMAEGGLASIPVNIPEFKEGGVIGFAVGNYVNPASPAGMAEDTEETTSSFTNALDAIGNLFPDLGLDSPEVQRKIVLSRLKQAKSEVTPGYFEQTTASERRKRAALAAQLENLIQAKVLPGVDVRESPDHAMAAQAIGTSGSAPKTETVSQVAQSPAASALEAKVAAANVAAKNAATRPPAAPSPASAPSSEAVPFQPIDMTESTLQYNRLKALQEKKPDFEAMGLANLAAQQQRDKESESFRRYAAIYGTGVQGINAGSAMVAAAGKFQDLENRAANSADAAKTALAKAKQAEAEGDVANLLKYQEEFNKHNTDYMQARATFATAKQGADSRAEVAAMRNEFNQRMSEARISEMLKGKTANLRDPNYVYDKISDNVTTQLKNAQEGPLGYKLKTVDDYTAAYDKLWNAEIVRMKAGGADVSLAEGQGKNLGAKPVKNYTFDSIK